MIKKTSLCKLNYNSWVDLLVTNPHVVELSGQAAPADKEQHKTIQFSHIIIPAREQLYETILRLFCLS